VSSEYKDGYAMDFIDYLIEESGFWFREENWATFIFYDDTFLFTFCHKGGVICISEVIDISLSNLDSSLCY